MNQDYTAPAEYIPLTFGLESLYPPMSLPAQQMRQLYMRLADPCRFAEFRLAGDGQGGRMAENNNRYLSLAADRMVYRDDFSQRTLQTFLEDLSLILNAVRETIHVPVLLHTKALVRMLMPNPLNDNTLAYFQNHMLATASANLGRFQRPLSGLGVRLVFPPTQDRHSTYQLRIEPYFRDMKMFFLENNAQFFDPVTRFEDLKDKFQETYDFIKEQAGPFVLSFSRPS